MWWKKILIGFIVLVVILYAAMHAALHFVDLNRFKPRITSAVQDATGRRLTIGGDLEIDFGLLPVLAAEDIALKNASWGSRQEMIHLKRFQVRIALLPLILGRLEIASVTLLGPDLLLERNASGDLNIPVLSSGNGSSDTKMPLIHRIEVENAHLAFIDRQSAAHLELILDHARAELPDADSPLEIDLEGMFNRTPVAVFGTIGRPLPAVLTGQQLPARLTVEIADNRFQISGSVENTDDFSGLDWRITGAGRSLPALAQLAGLEDLPDPGPFQFQGNVSGSPKQLALSNLNLHLGDRGLAKVFLRGHIKNLLQLQNVDLQVITEGDDLKNLEKLFGLIIPWQGNFRATARLVRSADDGIRLEIGEMEVGDNDVAATAALRLQRQKPHLTATIRSSRFDLRPLFAADAFKRADAGKKNATDPTTDETKSNQLPRKSLLERIDADLHLDTGTILLPQMVIHELKTQARLDNGRIRVQAEGSRPPDLEELAGISRLPDLGPIRLACDLIPTNGGLALRNVDLEAGSLQQARVMVSGSIDELLTPRGFNLDVRIEGDDATALGKYLLQPWPLRGKYAVATRMVDPGNNVFAFGPITGNLEDIDFIGSVKVAPYGKAVQVSIAVDAPRFNLRPFVWPGLEVPKSMKQQENLGPLDVTLGLLVQTGKLGIAELHLEVGSADLLAVSLRGDVADLKSLTGIRLDLEVSGREVAELSRMIGKPIPLQGAISLRTTIHDPESGAFRFDPLIASLADNRAIGAVELDRSVEPMRVAADLSASEIDLTALIPVPESKVKMESGMLEQAMDQQRVLPEWPIPPRYIQQLDADLRIQVDRVKLAGIDISGLSIKGKSQKDTLILNAEARTVLYRSGSEEPFDSFQMGGVVLTADGRAVGDRMTIESFRLLGGGPETIFVLLQGSVADTVRQTDIELTFDIHGQEAGYLWQLLDADYRATGPFSLSGSLTDPRPKQYRFKALKAAVGDSRVDGQLSIDYTGQRPRFTARISSPYLDLRPYFPELTEVAETKPTRESGNARSRKLFSDKPWPLEMLKKVDVAVSLDAAQVFSPRAAVKDLRFDLAVDDGNLVLKPLYFTRGGGTVTGEVSLRTSGAVPTLMAMVKVSGYDVGRELKELDRPKNVQGLLSGQIELIGPADSTAAFTGELKGQAVFTVTEGKINNRIIGTVYGDIGDTLLGIITPSRRRNSFTDLNCLVHSYDIHNGQAQHIGLLDTTQTTLVTTGTIDLPSESLDITLRSAAKSGVRVRGVGRIGFSLSRLTRPFKLSGTLTRPTMAVDSSQTALTIGKVLGGFALGPAGIAALLTDVSRGEKNSCLVAMGALEEGKEDLAPDELLESGDLLDQTADSLIKGGQKVIEKGEKAIQPNSGSNQP